MSRKEKEILFLESAVLFRINTSFNWYAPYQSSLLSFLSCYLQTENKQCDVVCYLYFVWWVGYLCQYFPRSKKWGLWCIPYLPTYLFCLLHFTFIIIKEGNILYSLQPTFSSNLKSVESILLISAYPVTTKSCSLSRFYFTPFSLSPKGYCWFHGFFWYDDRGTNTTKRSSLSFGWVKKCGWPIESFVKVMLWNVWYSDTQYTYQHI